MGGHSQQRAQLTQPLAPGEWEAHGGVGAREIAK